MPIPPPDVTYEVPRPVSLTGVYVVIVGILRDDPTTEVLVRSEDSFYRFGLPKHARVVRNFWKHIGVVDVSRLEEGAYQDERGGDGPYVLDGLAVGEDTPDEEGAVGTTVLHDVKMRS